MGGDRAFGASARQSRGSDGGELEQRSGRFAGLTEVALFSDALGLRPAFAVEEVWWHQEILVFKFAGVDSISEAEKLAGCEVRVPVSERIALEDGAYFHSDLVGCAVLDRASGRDIGTVSSVQDGLLELEGGALIPFAAGICVSIDITRREILAELPDGLLDLNHP